MVENSIEVRLWVFALLSHEGYELPYWAHIAPRSHGPNFKHYIDSTMMLPVINLGT